MYSLNFESQVYNTHHPRRQAVRLQPYPRNP